MPPEIECRSPAKVNLNLAVTGRRPDGYHRLVSLMACVDVYDRIRFRFEGARISLRCAAPGVPEDETNLAFRAAARFGEALARKGKSARLGLRMDLVKRIPAGAGLGGGSSNAATVLKVLNRYFDHPFSFEELSAIALSLGADVPFFLYGQPAVVTGIGERIAPYQGLAPFAVLIVFPGVGLSTAAVYRALNLRLTKCEKKLKKFLLKNEAFKADTHLCNDLELPAVQGCPDVAVIKSELLAQGALGAVMSGSGSAVLGLFENTDTARQARRAFAAHQGWQVFQGRVLV